MGAGRDVLVTLARSSALSRSLFFAHGSHLYGTSTALYRKSSASCIMRRVLWPVCLPLRGGGEQRGQHCSMPRVFMAVQQAVLASTLRAGELQFGKLDCLIDRQRKCTLASRQRARITRRRAALQSRVAEMYHPSSPTSVSLPSK